VEFAERREIAVVLPEAAARLIASRAMEAWGPQAALERGSSTVVGAWANRRGAANAPMGGCTIRWGVPGTDQATVVEIGWNPARAGDPAAVCQALNALVGWPLLRVT
jgi:hypothetical protein